MKIFTTVMTFFVALAFAQAEELVPLKDYLKTELSASAKMAKESFTMTAADKAEMAKIAADSEDESFTFYYGKKADGKLEKACAVVPQKGKEGPLTVGVCFDPVGLVTGVTILSSEEERGKKVAEKSWLKQFTGKKVSDAFQVGQDVDGVSGATWSSKAVSEAIRKSSFAYKKYVGGKK